MNNSTKLNKNLNVLGNKINKYRKQNNLSQAELSAKLELLGISIPKNSIQRLECNDRIIKDYELAGISKVLNVSIDLLLEDFIKTLQ